MKVSPIAPGASPHVNVNEGSSITPERAARAKAIINGTPPPADPQVERIESSAKRIRLKTQASPDRPIQELEAIEEQRNIPDTDESAVAEETKPLSPQLAALAKEKRALQVMRAELEKERAALKPAEGTKPAADIIAQLKTSPLKVLLENGVTYDQLTEEILASPEQNSSAAYAKLEAEVKALKEGLDNQSKSLTEKEARDRQQVLTQMRKQADALAAQGDAYQMVRDTNSQAAVIELIEKTFDTTGEVLDVTEALELVENELIDRGVRFASVQKVQSRITPAQAASQVGQAPVRQMKTLTSRDGTSPVMSSRERAILAFQGKLK